MMMTIHHCHKILSHDKRGVLSQNWGMLQHLLLQRRTATTAATHRGGSKGAWGRPPIQKSGPLCPQNEVHHADMLTVVYAIASLGWHWQVCHVNCVPHLPPWPPIASSILVFLEPPLAVQLRNSINENSLRIICLMSGEVL